MKSHTTEKRTLKTAPCEIDLAQKREYKDLNSGQNLVGGRPCPSGQTHGLTDGTTPPSAELSHPRGFRRPPCPPVPCLGNPESQAALPEVRLHDASSGGHINRNRQPHLTFTDGADNTTGDRRETSPQPQFAQEPPPVQDVTNHSDHQDHHHRQDNLREHSWISEIPPGGRRDDKDHRDRNVEQLLTILQGQHSTT